MTADKPEVQNQPRLLRVRTFAALTQQSVSAVYLALNEGRLKCVHIGPRTTRIPAAEIDRLIESSDSSAA